MSESEGGKAPSIDDYALAVGRLSNAWARLEHSAVNFMFNLTRMPMSPSSYVILHCYDFRDHLKAMKAGAVISSANLDWVDRVVETVDYIDNNLRPRRNRFIHDQWIGLAEGDGDVHLINREMKVARPQARMPRQVIPGTMTRHALEDVDATTTEINEHASYLGLLIVGRGFKKGEPLPAQLQEQPQRRFLRPPAGTPSPKGKRQPRRQRQRKASRE